MTNWRARALCAQIGASFFFPDDEPNGEHGWSDAVAICNMCPVKKACLLDALDSGDNYWGVRGGKTAGARRKMAKGMAA